MSKSSDQIAVLLVWEVEKAVIFQAGILYAGVATGGEDVEDVVLTTEGTG